jgi:hypothetical protein
LHNGIYGLERSPDLLSTDMYAIVDEQEIQRAVANQSILILTLEGFRYDGPDPETLDRFEACSIGDPPRSKAFKWIAEETLAPETR